MHKAREKNSLLLSGGIQKGHFMSSLLDTNQQRPLTRHTDQQHSDSLDREQHCAASNDTTVCYDTWWGHIGPGSQTPPAVLAISRMTQLCGRGILQPNQCSPSYSQREGPWAKGKLPGQHHPSRGCAGYTSSLMLQTSRVSQRRTG